jgi:hypothetical protein
MHASCREHRVKKHGKVPSLSIHTRQEIAEQQGKKGVKRMISLSSPLAPQQVGSSHFFVCMLHAHSSSLLLAVS